MIAIMTVTGLDHTGIISAVTTRLAELGVNIINLNQMLIDGYFTMILEGQCPETISIDELREAMDEVGAQEHLDIRVQSDAIFQAMHKL